MNDDQDPQDPEHWMRSGSAIVAGWLVGLLALAAGLLLALAAKP